MAKVNVYEGKLAKTTKEAMNASKEAEKVSRQTLKFNINQEKALPLSWYGIQPTRKNPAVLGFFYKTQDGAEGWCYATDLVTSGITKETGEYTGIPVTIKDGVIAKA